MHQQELTGSLRVLYSPNGAELKIVSPQLLHIADRSFYLGPFANQRDLDAGADSTGRHPVALRVHVLDELLNDHDAPAKGQVASARQQLETLWQLWITDQHGVESDQEPSGGDGKGSKRPASLSSGRCSTPPP